MVTLKSGHVRLNQKLKGCDDDVSGKPSGAATLATTHVGIGRNQTATFKPIIDMCNSEEISKEFKLIDRYWKASNYLAVGQVSLREQLCS